MLFILTNIIKSNKKHHPLSKRMVFLFFSYLFINTACAAASLAIGTLNGEQET